MNSTMQASKVITARTALRATRVNGVSALPAKPVSKSASRRSAVIVRAEETPTTSTPEPVKFKVLDERLTPLYEAAEGVEYSVGGERWQDLMAFEGFAPEVINGRLAMLGFVAAFGAELTTQQSFMTQLGGNFFVVATHLALFAAASFAPAIITGKPLPELVKAANGQEAAGFGGSGFPEQLKMLTPEVELLNGRAAMVGIGSMVILETLSGGPLF